MKEKLSDIIFHLRTRPESYLLGYDSYASLVCFLIGFGEGTKESGRNIMSEFDNWLQKKVEKKFSIHWSGYILKEMCGKNEEKATSQLLRLMEEFCKED